MMRATVAAILLVSAVISKQCVCTDFGDEDDEYSGDYDNDYGPDEPLGEAGPSIAQHIKGVVDIDHITFDKIALGGQPTFVTFYSTDASDNSADVRMIIEDVAETLGAHLSLIMAKIDVTDGGSAQLRARFGTYRTPFHLFFANEVAEPVEYFMDTQVPDAAEALERWLVQRAGQPYELKALGSLVAKFLAEPNDRGSILQQAEAILPKLTPSQATVGKWYLKTMSNMIKKGNDYLATEFTRLDNLLKAQSSMKADKYAEFEQRKSILNVFGGGDLA